MSKTVNTELEGGTAAGDDDPDITTPDTKL
jgi:hypothetical protein